MRSLKRIKNRAGVLIICEKEKKVLLINRIKEGKEYYVIPGGNVEFGETARQTAKREMLEMLKYKVGDVEEVFSVSKKDSIETYFKTYADDVFEVRIHGEEGRCQSIDNRYIPTWVNYIDIQNINIRPKESKKHIIETLLSLR